MKKIKEAGINLLNSMKKHKVITTLSFVVLLVAIITFYTTFGFWTGSASYSFLKGTTSYPAYIDINDVRYELRYYIKSTEVDDYEFSAVSPTQAYENGYITYNSSKSSCTGCTSVNSIVVSENGYIVPVANADVVTASLYFDLTTNVETTPDVQLIFKKTPSNCGGPSSCSAVVTHDSLEKLFSEGYAISSGSCTKGATYKVNYKKATIDVTLDPSSMTGTAVPDTVCTLTFSNDPTTSRSLVAKLKAGSSISTQDGINDYIADDDEGLYAIPDDYGMSYIYRGNVTNNYVRLGSTYWRVIRINGDGSIRLIYNGAEATGNGASCSWCSINTGMFSTQYQHYHMDNATVPYLRLYPAYSVNNLRNLNYSTPSNIMSVLYNYYANNLLTYDRLISDSTTFCNSVSYGECEDGEGNPILCGTDNGPVKSRSSMYYGKIAYFDTPPSGLDLRCDAAADIFSKNFNSKKYYDTSLRNSDFPAWTMLEYPIGTITDVEYILAGHMERYMDNYSTNTSTYLDSNLDYWTISPYFSGGTNHFEVYMWYVESTGELANTTLNESLGIRPVISLAPGVRITTVSGQDGSITHPYRIETTT
jgi:hypothetical protein